MDDAKAPIDVYDESRLFRVDVRGSDRASMREQARLAAAEFWQVDARNVQVTLGTVSPERERFVPHLGVHRRIVGYRATAECRRLDPPPRDPDELEHLAPLEAD